MAEITRLGLANFTRHWSGEFHPTPTFPLKYNPQSLLRPVFSCNSSEFSDYFAAVKRDGTVCINSNFNSDIRKEVSKWNNVVSVLIVGGNIYGLRNDGTVLRTDHDSIYGRSYLDEWSDVVSIIRVGSYLFGLTAKGSLVFPRKMFFDDDKVYQECRDWKNIRILYSRLGSNALVGLTSEDKVLYVGDLSKYTNINHLLNFNPLVIDGWFGNVAVLSKDNKVYYNGRFQSAMKKGIALKELVWLVGDDLSEHLLVGLEDDGTTVVMYCNPAEDKAPRYVQSVGNSIKSWKNIIAIYTVDSAADYLIGLKSDGSFVYAFSKYNMSTLEAKTLPLLLLKRLDYKHVYKHIDRVALSELDGWNLFS